MQLESLWCLQRSVIADLWVTSCCSGALTRLLSRTSRTTNACTTRSSSFARYYRDEGLSHNCDAASTTVVTLAAEPCIKQKLVTRAPLVHTHSGLCLVKITARISISPCSSSPIITGCHALMLISSI